MTVETFDTPFFDGLPERIRVGSVWYNITISDKNIMSEEGPLGMTRRDLCEIVIRETGNVSQDLNTVIHEIGHAIYNTQDLHHADEEEQIVNRWTNGWLAFLYDNPDFTSWYTNALEEVGVCGR